MGKTALFIVDVQNDFLPSDGALAVPNGREVLPVIFDLLDPEKWVWDVVIATQDYHPTGHISFASTHGKQPFTTETVTDAHGKKYQQELWPDHAVIGTKGAEIEKELRNHFEPWKGKMKIARKAYCRLLEAYSSFEGYLTEATDPKEAPQTDGGDMPENVLPHDTEVAVYLRQQGVEKVIVTGLASEYCILQTVLASVSAGFETVVVAPGIRGIDPKAVEQALEKMDAVGAKIIGRAEGEDWKGYLREATR